MIILPYLESLKIIEDVAAVAKPVIENCSTENSCGRILARDLVCPEDNPLFDNSAMDGFAVSSLQTSKATALGPTEIPIFKTLGAGDHSQEEIPSGVAVEIMTGAQIPSRMLDTIVRLEDANIIGPTDERFIRFEHPVAPAMHVRQRGSDLRVGQGLLRAGTTLRPLSLMGLATFGITTVPVYKTPRVVLFSTGNELVDFRSGTPGPSQIRNSTAIFIEKYLTSFGCHVQNFGIIGDDKFSLQTAFDRALSESPDLIISTGGVSVGKFDWVTEVLSELGIAIHFHKCAIRPGKPILFGSRGTTRFFGVPGNPISSAVAVRFFIDPFLRVYFGKAKDVSVQARLLDDVRKPEGLRCFFRAQNLFEGTEHFVRVLEGQESYRIRSSLEANCWVVLPEEGTLVAKGTPVTVQSLYGVEERNILNG